MDNKRISILDGFRVIAILIVMLYHYYARFNPEKYSYSFPTATLFNFGRLGVEFFFIISGFVITLTLTRCSSFIEFIKKRFSRLIPGMLVCSIATFTVLRIIDVNFLFPESHSFFNWLISNSFISPKLVNLFFSSNVDYVDGAYWSLWVEISFYIIVSVLYFWNKAKLLRNYSIVVFASLALYYLFITSVGKALITKFVSEEVYLFLHDLVVIFSFLRFSAWFLLGIILYRLYFTKSKKYLYFFTRTFLIQLIMMGISAESILFAVSVYSLLLLFVFKPKYISFLGNPFFARLGLVSYSIYLIHQHVGVVLISLFSPYFSTFNCFIGLLCILLSSLFALYSYQYLEQPLSKALKKLLFKN
jgi:peptidoglycan/LPS O-acetylase OafA/YrhL